MVRLGRRGSVWIVGAGYGMAGCGRHGLAMRGPVWSVKASRGRPGVAAKVGSGVVRFGSAGMARLGVVSCGWASPGRQVAVRRGTASFGSVGAGKACRGELSPGTAGTDERR